MVHPKFATVNGVILQPDVGASLHVDERPTSAMVEAEDKAVTRGDVSEAVRLQIDA